MKRILVAINSLVTTTHPAYSNHIQFFFRLGRSYTDIDFILFNPSRMSIDRMRNAAAVTAIQQECDGLLFLDDDVLVPINGLKKLLVADADVAAGNVIIRGYPFENMWFKYTDAEKKDMRPMPDANLPETPGLIDVDAVGFSFCLIKVDALRKLPAPFFVTGLTNTEDIYFCLKLKDAFPEAIIKVDTSLGCAHILWNETISSANKLEYKKYYETQNMDQAEEQRIKLESSSLPPRKTDDRGLSYYGEMKDLVTNLDIKDISHD